MTSPLSQSEWALALSSHGAHLSPSILSSLPDDDRALRNADYQRLRREREARKARRAQYGRLIWFAYRLPLNMCVCLSEGQTQTAHRNPFIPIPHQVWLRHSPGNPRKNLHPVRVDTSNRRGSLPSQHDYFMSYSTVCWTWLYRAENRNMTLQWDPSV